MKNNKTIRNNGYVLIRNGAMATLTALLLSGCSSISVPNALNPTKWDFFADDAQTEVAQQTSDENQGLAADSSAPKPADRDVGAGSGLSADSASGNYASAPISRQGAPTDVLSPNATMRDEAPAPAAVAVTPVRPAAPAQVLSPKQVRAPAPASAPATKTMVAETAPPPPVFNAPKPPSAGDASSRELPIIQPRISNEAPPPEPSLRVRVPANSGAPTRSRFDTIVISSVGIEDPAPAQTAPASSVPVASAPTSTVTPSVSGSGAAVRFPVPGSTTVQAVQSVSVGGMLRVATIYFDNNSDTLNDRDMNIVTASAQLLNERGGTLFVVGHASSRTADMDYVKHAMTNFQISTARANSIARALRRVGVDRNQIKIHAVSDTVPLYYEVMPSGESGNRRVEIYLAP